MKRNSALFALGFILLGLQITFVLPAFAQYLDKDSKIAFTSQRDGNPEIYLMNPDGSEQVRLTQNSAYDGYARWSPDGKQIAFVSNRDGNSEIYIMNVDGSNQTRLTTHPDEDTSPSWSPDGSMIAFNTGRFGDGSAEILRRNISGGETWGLNPTRLTFAQPHHSARANNFISWSPDGKQIAFESDRDRDDPEIYLINAVDGTNAQRLTYTRALDEVPSWSPDGKQILFSSDMHDKPQSGEYDIYIMNRDGSNQRRLTDSPSQDTYPSMSPDGTMIVFESARHGYPEIYLMKADGSEQTRLTFFTGQQSNNQEQSGGNGNPSWSPFLK